MRRRSLLLSAATAGLPGLAAAQSDPWGVDAGYPTGWSEGFNRGTRTRVGNYSGGYESMFPHHVIAAPATALPLDTALLPDFKYRWGLFSRTPADYMQRWPVTGLLIVRKASVVVERYGHARTAAMRLTSWSMAKSVTALLLGICLDRKLIDSYDDPAEKYLPELAGTLHGQTTLRNLSNMSSGADIVHDRDNPTIYPEAFIGRSSSIRRTVAGWNRRREEQGQRYNYNELCPLTLGLVMRKVTGGSLSQFAEEALWKPLGAEADATWTTDAERQEFNCIGFAARLRDWARLGMLVAGRGELGGRRIVSQRWIDECTQWGPLDRQVRVGVAGPAFGYKAHMWHSKPDGSRLSFVGHHGQRVVIDMPSQTVLVHTAVDHQGDWLTELRTLMDAAVEL
jgi:CubicO group peptidase (beta-lactamase class C family)